MKDVLEGLKRKAAKVHLLFATDLGKEVLQILRDEFDHEDLRGDSVEETYYNLGRRDAVIYLAQLRDAGIDG